MWQKSHILLMGTASTTAANPVVFYETNPLRFGANYPVGLRDIRRNPQFKPDGSEIAVFSTINPSGLYLIDTKTWEASLAPFTNAAASITAGYAYSPDGTMFFYPGNFGSNTRLFNADTWEVIRTGVPPGDTGTPSSTTQYMGVCWSPDSSLLVFPVGGTGATAGAGVRIVDVATWTDVVPRSSIDIGGVPLGTIHDVAFSPDGEYLAIAGNNAPYLVVLETENWTRVLQDKLSVLAGTARSVSWSADGQMLAVAYAVSPYIRLHYRYLDWAGFSVSPTPAATSRLAKFDPTGRYLAISMSGSTNGVGRIVDTYILETIFSSGLAGANDYFYPAWSPVPVARDIEVKTLNREGEPVSRDVWCVERGPGGVLLRAGTSDPVTGVVRLPIVTGNEATLVVADGSDGEDDAADREDKIIRIPAEEEDA